MGALSSTSSSFGNAAASTRLDNQPNGALFIDDTLKQQALAEEEAAMNQYKVTVLDRVKSLFYPPKVLHAPSIYFTQGWKS